MWSIYNWMYETNISDSPPKIITGPGRNLPPIESMLREAKMSLKSPEVVEELQSLSKVTEAMLTRDRLKKIEVEPRQTEWPCTNPLFQELRVKAIQMQLVC